MTPTAPKWLEIISWNIGDATSRQACAPEFLSLCVLLLHSVKSLNINSSSYQPDQAPHSPDYVLLVRPPCDLFRTRVFLPIFTGPPSGPVDPARTFLQGLLGRNGDGYFHSFLFTQSFFKVAKLRSLLQISSWQMDESFDPNLSDTTSFHIYNFIKCLREYAHQPALLPAGGMPLIHVKQLAQFIISWFRGMDVQYDLQSSKFDSSILLGPTLST
jgi:hypothetical protein